MHLPIRDPLLPTFNETRTPTSRKYVAEQGIVMKTDQKHVELFGRTPPFLL